MRTAVDSIVYRQDSERLKISSKIQVSVQSLEMNYDAELVVRRLYAGLVRIVGDWIFDYPA